MRRMNFNFRGCLLRQIARPLAILLASGAASPAVADYIKHPSAVFAGLDKITGRIISFEVAIDETVQFGSLQITPRACYTRPPTEAPLTDAFVEVDEVSATNEYKRIFSGWMFAASPGLHGIEHPVYDAWMTSCKGGTTIVRVGPDGGQQVRETEFVQPLPKPGTTRPAQRLPRPAANPTGALGAPVEVGAAPGAAPPRQRAPAPPAQRTNNQQQQRGAPAQTFFPTTTGPLGN